MARYDNYAKDIREMSRLRDFFLAVMVLGCGALVGAISAVAVIYIP